DCGMQTYVVNELSIQYQRGNLGRVKCLQSVALRLSLGILIAGLLVAIAAVTLAPMNSVLGLSMTRAAVSAIVVLMATEILLGIFWGQLNGMLRSFGYPHRAEIWAQTYTLVTVLITLGMVVSHARMALIPAARLAAFLGLMGISLVEL